MDEKGVFEILKEALPNTDTACLLEVAYTVNRAYFKDGCSTCTSCDGEGTVICSSCGGMGTL